MERCPSVCVDLGLERGFQRLVRVAGSQEVGVADEERLFVVVGVYEPAGYAIRPVAAYFPCVGVEHVHAVDLYLDLAIVSVEDVDVRLAEDDDRLPLPVFFRSSAMWRSAFIRAFSTGTRPRLSNSVVCAS